MMAITVKVTKVESFATLTMSSPLTPRERKNMKMNKTRIPRMVIQGVKVVMMTCASGTMMKRSESAIAATALNAVLSPKNFVLWKSA